MGDFNEDVRQGNTIRTLKQLGLINVWQGKEQSPTFQQGSVPIDTILVTTEIYPERSGYIRSMSDHLCLWIDIKAMKLFKQLNHPIPAARRRLQCNDPWIIKKYNNQLWRLVQEKKIHEQYVQLCDMTISPFRQERLWETIDKQMLKVRLDAEKKCRKFKMGQVQWMPEYSREMLTLKYWCLALKICEGKSINK
jgi:hypothetical protein